MTSYKKEKHAYFLHLPALSISVFGNRHVFVMIVSYQLSNGLK
ncbi:hypothetical protein K710_1796 [Streptococcus iniae SF1]|nr:hypothetical protein [Streptococcus iniae]AGM99546.1 hypothetical protein K710_1796 [Streptococcus iniae SF1]EKB51992.1 hypothetical protein A0G_1898 [Streptococcus iniae 9117]